MDLQPWDYYDDKLQPKGNTAEVVSLLETVMKRNPDHAGALHLYVHAVEASADPQRGVVAADRLRTLIPGSGHLVHMPAHIYRAGWALARCRRREPDGDHRRQRLSRDVRPQRQARVSARLRAAQPALPVVCGQHGRCEQDRPGRRAQDGGTRQPAGPDAATGIRAGCSTTG